MEHELRCLKNRLEDIRHEDSEEKILIEVATEPCSDSGDNLGFSSVESLLETPEKQARLLRLQEQSRAIVRQKGKEKAEVEKSRLRAAFDAGHRPVSEDAKESNRTGFKIVLLGGAQRRRVVRDLGRSFKRRINNAVSEFHIKFPYQGDT